MFLLQASQARMHAVTSGDDGGDVSDR